MNRWNQVFIASHKIFFIIFGLFGNVNLIYIILSTPKLRSKSSYLQALQSLAHIFCILNSFIDVHLLLSDAQMLKESCFHVIFPIVFAFCFQTSIMLFILLDILLFVLFPTVARAFEDWKYVLGMSTLPCLWGIAIVAFGFIQEPEFRMVFMCNPPSALNREVRKVLFPVTVVVNTLSFIIFVILIILFQKKGNAQCLKAMTHLQVSAALFIFSTYLNTFAVNVFVMLGYSGDDLIDLIGNISITAMLSYSHTFYTIIWRSPEYRRRFIGLYCKTSGARVSNCEPTIVKNRSNGP